MLKDGIKRKKKYGSNVPDVNSTCNRMLPDLLTDFRSRVASIEERRHKTHKKCPWYDVLASRI